MQLVEIVYEVCDAVGLPRPNTVAGSNQQLARQMLSLANATIRELAKKDWRELEVQSSFNTAIGDPEYRLAGDFARLASNTAISENDMRILRGSTTVSQWAALANANFLQYAKYYLRTNNRAQTIRITPTPTVVETVSYTYFTKYPVFDADAVAKAVFTLDTDTCLFPDALMIAGLKWRIKHAKGMEYSEDYNDYIRMFEIELTQSNSPGDIPVAATMQTDLAFCDPYMPESGFGS